MHLQLTCTSLHEFSKPKFFHKIGPGVDTFCSPWGFSHVTVDGMDFFFTGFTVRIDPRDSNSFSNHLFGAIPQSLFIRGLPIASLTIYFARFHSPYSSAGFQYQEAVSLIMVYRTILIKIHWITLYQTLMKMKRFDQIMETL